MKKTIITGAVCLAIGAAATYLVLCYVIPEIRIKWITKTETIYVKKPVTCADYQKCAESEIAIDAELKDAMLKIIAQDMCKRGERTMKIDVRPPQAPSHALQVILTGAYGRESYEQRYMFGYGGSLLYHYNFGPASLGAGPGFLKIGRDIDILVNVAGTLRFN